MVQEVQMAWYLSLQKKARAGTSKIEFNYFTGTQNPTGKTRIFKFQTMG